MDGVLVREKKNLVIVGYYGFGNLGDEAIRAALRAALNERVTQTADRILEELLAEAPLSRLGRKDKRAEALSLFGAGDHPVLRKLRKLDPDRLTPLEALELLARLKKEL